jgi:NADPH-dependent 2,4-dienoyl-CoA reductase/sulfur reductase-like enzyme
MKLVVVGGDAAGMSAASQARRRRPASDLQIVAFERSSWVSYSACGEPYHVAGWVDPLERLVARSPAQFADMDIDVRIRHEVTSIDLDRRTVSVSDLDAGENREEGFDLLMLGMGATAIRPDIAGIDLPGVHELRTLDDAARLRAIAETGPGAAVVIGGGYIGLEAAEAFHHQGWSVTVLTSGQSVLERSIDPDLAASLADSMAAMGITVVTETRVRCINGSEQVVSVGCVYGAIHPADVVIMGLGSRPEVGIAAEAGIPLGETGAIAVDNRQRTGVDGVWAAGDCAEAPHLLTGKPVNYHLGTIANKTGRVAGINIGGEEATFPGVLGTSITKVCDTEVASTGLRLGDARTWGFDAVEGTARGTTTAGYWPTASPITIRAVAERGSGRLLGAQIVGGPGAAKRIDVFATAIWTGMSAGELAWTDLAYAPPFSGVWDLIHIAAREAADAAG